MPNHLTRGLPNDYREANGYSTEAVHRWPRDDDQEQTEATIQMTYTETLPNAESRDAAISICNEQSGCPRAEPRSYRGEYDHLL